MSEGPPFKPIQTPEPDSNRDYYGTLGVSRTATEKEIKEAYRKIARATHSDTKGDTSKEGEFREATKAYKVLTDNDSRRRYDAMREGDILIPMDRRQEEPVPTYTPAPAAQQESSKERGYRILNEWLKAAQDSYPQFLSGLNIEFREDALIIMTMNSLPVYIDGTRKGIPLSVRKSADKLNLEERTRCKQEFINMIVGIAQRNKREQALKKAQKK